VCHESQKNKVKNTPSAETVAAAAIMALLHTINAVRPLHARSMAAGIIGQGDDWQATKTRGEGKDKGGRGWQQQGRITMTVTFPQQSSGNKKH
jgi:hypothetical protein